MAGIVAGETIKTVNAVTPKDATAVSDLVANSTATMTLVVISSAGVERTVNVALRKTRPRLGAICDLTGWRQPGVTAANNESVTLFDGPFAFTASGILDKGIVFLRLRVTNNSDQPLAIGPSLFSATDAGGQTLKVLMPVEVMCQLYGDNGAHLLSLKRKAKQTLEADNGTHDEAEFACPAGTGPGRLAKSKKEFAEANADYIAQESLWPASCPPGGTVDGLVYFPEAAMLPLTLQATIESHHFKVQLGMPQPSQHVMKQDDLEAFFEKQKKGTPLRLTLRKGKVFVGRFSSYDADNEKIWFDTPTSHLLNTTSYPLTSVESAEVIEQVPATPQPTEHAN